MAIISPTTLTKDTWFKVLTNVTTTGKVVILDQNVDPTRYLAAIVTPSGADAPASDYAGGIEFKKSINANNNVAMDVYVMAKDQDGLVMIFP